MPSEYTVYSSASKARLVVQRMVDAEFRRRENRALVDQVFDGWPPYTDQEAIDNNIETNVNFLEGTMLAHDARNQYRNAFMKPGNFFTVGVDGWQNRTERMRAGKIITSEMNRIMKRSRPYRETLKGQFANVVIHGYAPVAWPDRDSWRPIGYAVNELLIPDKTYLDLSNLNHFALYKEYTPFEFWQITRKMRQGWTQSMVNRIMGDLIKKVLEGQQEQREDWDRYRNPERIAEELKENAGYYWTDACPMVRTWTLYQRDLRGDTKEGWLRFMIPWEGIEDMKDEFIFKSNQVYAEDHSHIMHTLWGNIANKAPFRFHSVRSLGFLLYSVVQLQNRLRCKLTDAIFENLLWYFRVVDPTDRDRIQRIDLHNLGIIPEGVTIVGPNERHTPDTNLVSLGIGQNRQLMGEAAASFRGQREPTEGKTPKSARQVTAEMTQVQQMVTAILGSAYDDYEFQASEISRRFAKKVSTDNEVKEFRERVRKQGVSPRWLEFERWEVKPVRVLGGGNKLLEQAQADLMMKIRPLLDPDAQRETLHLYVEANTDDPNLANDMVPMDRQMFPSHSIIEAQQSAGALLLGLPVGIPQEVNRNEYIGALLQSLNAKIQQIEQSGSIPSDVPELRGLMNLSAHIKQNLEIFQQDEQQEALAREFANQIAQADNLIRAYGQRLAQKMKAEQANNGNDPKVMAEIQKDMVKETVKARGKALAQNLSAQQKQAAWVQEQRREEATHQQELRQDQERFDLEMNAEAMKAAANAQVAVRATRR